MFAGPARFRAWAAASVRYLAAVRWKKVSIVGVGLLGGSLGQALRGRKLASQVVGCVRRETSLRECCSAGAVDAATLDFSEGVANADLIVLCTPIAQMRGILQPLLPQLKRGAIVTDVGSVKGTVVRDLEKLVARAGAYFVGSHPMAGSERMGVTAARPDLYRGAICVVTPTKNSNPRAVRAVARLWKSVGARVLQLPPVVHDQLVARSSHLPHLLAAQLVNHALGNGSEAGSLLCATGFRDTTRVASGSPEMWRDIAVANRVNLARSLDQFIGQLRVLRETVRAGDGEAIARFLEEAKGRRDAWCSQSRIATQE
jgi:prephenate dehydrogenase